MPHRIWKSFDNQLGFKCPLFIAVHMLPQTIDDQGAVREKACCVFKVKQQPKLKARIRLGELDPKSTLQLPRNSSKSATRTKGFLQIENNPNLVVGNGRSHPGFTFSGIAQLYRLASKG